MSQENTPVTVPRAERIETLLSKDPEFKEAVKGKKEGSLVARDGRPKAFHVNVIKVTEAIHASGKDAYTFPKADVLKLARETLNTTATAVPASSHRVRTSTEAETQKTPKSTAATPKSIAATPKSTAAAPTTTPENVKGNPFYAILSLLISARQTADQDTHAGAAERRAELDKVLDKYTSVFTANRSA